MNAKIKQAFDMQKENAKCLFFSSLEAVNFTDKISKILPAYFFTF